jgi:hypothetical protein
MKALEADRCHESTFVGFPIISHRSSIALPRVVSGLWSIGLGADEAEATRQG